MKEFYTNVAVSRGQILVRGHADGVPFKERVDFSPTHYTITESETGFKSLDGDNLKPIKFDSITEAKNFTSKFSDVEGMREVFGFDRYAYNYIYEKYRKMEYDTSKISVVYFDIECKSDKGFPSPDLAANELTAISLRKGDLTIVLGTVDYVEHKPDVVYVKCKDETDLIYKFIDVWKKFDPDIISGWNIEFFDIPYLVNRINTVLGEHVSKQLSPWNQVHAYTAHDKFGREQSSYTFVGISTIDMMAAYKKFSFKNQESFSLNYIAHVELGEEKTDYSEYESLHDFYLKNPQKFIEYNIQDNDLVYRINEKTGLIDQIVELAYSAKVNFADAFGSVLIWEVIIKNYLEDKGIIVPTTRKRNHKKAPIMGAFVKEPVPGRYKWVVGLDLDSLYPHLIMQYNISPETLVQCIRALMERMPIEDILAGKIGTDDIISERLAKGYGYTPNGCFFRNDVRGFLPSLMDTMYTDRKSFKRRMTEARKQNNIDPSPELETLITQLNNRQMAIKIALNSAYGALSNEYCMFYDLNLAEAITYSGQLAIKWIAQELNVYFNKLLHTVDKDYVIASDTDSAYLCLDELVKSVFPEGAPSETIVKFLEKINETKINPLIERTYERLREMTGAYEQKMSMKVESISEVGIWKKKKKYALAMWWDEGVFLKEVKVKIKGLEAIQSSTPELCRDGIKKALKFILFDEKDKLLQLIDDYELKFRAASFEEIAATAGVSDMEKYYDPNTIFKKGCSFHTRGALLYNKLIKEKKIDHLYQKIQSGDKIKYCYMKTPNPVQQNVFSVFNRFPKELGLEKYIDYDTQFEKEFKGPIDGLAQVVGWDINNNATLEAFFG